MPAFIDITGQRFGRLTVIKRVGRKNDGHAAWQCRCDCGTKTIVSGSSLRKGDSQSCGCLKPTVITLARMTHGHSRTVEHRTWMNIHYRCNNPDSKDFPNYGGRGIKVCKRWRHFENFLADMGPRPKGYSIERINNDKNYKPSNCKWIPIGEQQKNQRRTKRK
jgi:hypothetical protein